MLSFLKVLGALPWVRKVVSFLLPWLWSKAGQLLVEYGGFIGKCVEQAEKQTSLTGPEKFQLVWKALIAKAGQDFTAEKIGHDLLDLVMPDEQLTVKRTAKTVIDLVVDLVKSQLEKQK